MKTTIEISDAPPHEARELAARDGVTLRTLIERGLQRVVTELSDGTLFKLRRAGFRGEGLRAEFRAASWEAANGGAGAFLGPGQRVAPLRYDAAPSSVRSRG